MSYLTLIGSMVISLAAAQIWALDGMWALGIWIVSLFTLELVVEACGY